MRRSAQLFLLTVAILFLNPLAAFAQDSQQPADETSYGVVSLDGNRLFSIESSLGPISARSRAERVRTTIKQLAEDKKAHPSTVATVEQDGCTEIVLGDHHIMTVTEGDANLAGVTRQKLAATYAERIKASLTGRIQREHAPENLMASLINTGIATGGLIVTLIVTFFIAGKVRNTLNRWRGKYIRTIRLQELELLREETIYAILVGIVKLARTVIVWLLVISYLITALGLFPKTEHLARELKDQIYNAAANVVVPAILGYVPNLFFLVVIILLTRYVLKFVKFLATQMESGTLSLPGFEPEWVGPTANILKFLIAVFAAMLAFPYLPGSGSPAFQQVAIFLGVLVSLGSSGAVAHIISGVFLTYTGAFRLNDRVKIADTVGDVVQRSLLATRVRTIKQEYITIPNGMVLGSHIINYSASGTSPGLILHTEVTLGYDVPWRKAHELLIEAARRTDDIASEPEPFVLQTSLNDHHVAYQLNAYTQNAGVMAVSYSKLHQNIQDVFREADIEILSPEYRSMRNGNPSTVPKS